MGWRFRRSLKLGLLKLNFSKSGVGYSVGERGYRVGKDAKGRSYTAASIPGTGLYNRSYSSQGRTAGGDATPVSSVTAKQSAGSGRGIVVAFFAGAVSDGSVLFPSVHPARSGPGGCERARSAAHARQASQAAARASNEEDHSLPADSIYNKPSVCALMDRG